MLEARPAGLSFLSNVLRFPELDSTQDMARRILQTLAADDVVPPPTLVVAGAQSRGRGRAGRSWQSAPGGLYATFLVPAAGIAESLHRPLEAAVVAAEALAAAFGAPIRVKWPNDLLDPDGRKLAGLLLEHVPSGEASFLLVGIGVNVAPVDFPGSVSISELCSRSVDVEEVLAALAAAFDRALASPAPREEILRRWSGLSFHAPGDRIRVRRGEESLEGSFRGLDEVGRLLLETPAGVEKIASADVEA